MEFAVLLLIAPVPSSEAELLQCEIVSFGVALRPEEQVFFSRAGMSESGPVPNLTAFSAASASEE